MRQPTEMELRAAEALAVARGCRWERCGDNDREMVIEEARAAIRAMREPTDEMRMAAPPRVLEKLAYRDLGDTWKSMIDAASPRSK